MKCWTTWLGVASTLALVGFAAAACDGPTIIIQNVIGDAGGATDGQDAGADAGDQADAGVDAGEVVTSCTAGTVTANPTPLYVELVVASLPNSSVAWAAKLALPKLPFDDVSFGLGLKPTADPDVDDAGIRAAQRDGGIVGIEGFRGLLRDLPQVFTNSRQVDLEDLIARARTAADSTYYGTRAQYAQLRAWSPSGTLRPNGRRALLIVQDFRAAGLQGPGGATDVLDPLGEAIAPEPVMTGLVDARNPYGNSGAWLNALPALTALGMHGDPDCDNAAFPPNQRPAGTPQTWGDDPHALCVPTIYPDSNNQFDDLSLPAAIKTVIGELRACEYQVRGFDSRFGGNLAFAIKGPNGFSQTLNQLRNADATRITASSGMRSKPAGVVLDDVDHPSKVTVTGEACLAMRRDQARMLEITTTCR